MTLPLNRIIVVLMLALTRKHKTKLKRTIIILFIGILLQSCGNTKTESSTTKKIDDYLNKISEDNEIPGIALAIIKDGNFIHKKYYGYSNLDYEIPVNKKTIFPLFSTSKIFATVAIHKSIEEEVQLISSTAKNCLESACLKPEDINLIVLTGGSTEIPLLQNTFRNIFSNAEFSEENKLSSVATGLAYDSARRFK